VLARSLNSLLDLTPKSCLLLRINFSSSEIPAPAASFVKLLRDKNRVEIFGLSRRKTEMK
jgi:hypothetical protein